MISIIIPAYNREKFIGKCIQSALAQSIRDIEIIAVDDGSTDGTGKICDSFAKSDRRIKVVHQPNGGVSAARQAGIDMAVGEWTCFLDSDDTLPKEALERYSKKFSENPDIIVSGCTHTLDVGGFVSGITDYSICPALWGKMFKTDFVKKNMPALPRDLVMGEDMIANLVLGRNALRIATIPELQYNVTLDNATSVMKTFKKNFEYENFFFAEFKKLFLDKCSSLPCYDTLVRNSVLLRLNGYKNVVLDGNGINTASEEWIDFLLQLKSNDIKLGPSDKLFLKMQNSQKMYSTLMNLYLRIRK